MAGGRAEAGLGGAPSPPLVVAGPGPAACPSLPPQFGDLCCRVSCMGRSTEHCHKSNVNGVGNLKKLLVSLAEINSSVHSYENGELFLLRFLFCIPTGTLGETGYSNTCPSTA